VSEDVYRITVRIEAPVQDTEVTDRVRDAVENLFPNAEFHEEPGKLVATTHSLDAFSERLYEQEILDTARGVFESNLTGDGFAFDLKKQPAFQGVVNFAVGNPDELGDVHVEVDVDDPSARAFVDQVAPETEDGVPVGHEDFDP
jgi:predicted RNA binding protein with dsRBD fold (UPF0201 family)